MNLAPLSAPLISATKTDALAADDGDGVAGSGDTIRYTVQISNSGAAAALGLLFADTIDPNTTLVGGSLKTTPLARDDSYNASGNIQISIPAPGLLSNDLDPDGNTPGLVVSSVNSAGTQGEVNVNPDGSFTFNPAPGFQGNTSFTYTITDTDGNTRTAQVSVGVSGMIWFVNASASCPCDGRLTSPFNALTGANSFGALVSDAAGDNIFVYSGNYAGGLVLLDNQKLIGQGAGASLSSITGIVPPAGSLALPSTGGARPVVTSSANNLTLGSNNLVRGLNLNNNGATALNGNNFGNLLIDEMSVANSNGVAINLTNGTPDATFTSVSASGGAQGILVSDTAGSFTVEGTGTTDGSGGTIQNVTGRGASFVNASNVTLKNINFSNTGTTDGGLATCSTDAVGNTGCNGAIHLQGTNGVVLDNVETNGGQYGINGNNVTNFSLLNSLIQNHGNGANEHGVRFIGLYGTSAITGTTVTGSAVDNVRIVNSSAPALSLSVQASTFQNTSALLGNTGLNLIGTGAASISVNVQGSTFQNNRASGLATTFSNSATQNITVTNNGATRSLFQNNNIGIDLGTDNDADMIFQINNTNFFNQSAQAINLLTATTATANSQTNGAISGNTIGNSSVDSGSDTAEGIRGSLRSNGSESILITGNTITHTDRQGINIESLSGNGNGSLIITLNNVGQPDNNESFPVASVNGMFFSSRNARQTCLNIDDNNSANKGAGSFGYQVRQANTAVFRLEGYAGASNNASQVATFIAARNTTGTAGVQTTATGTIVNYTGGICGGPTFPAAASMSLMSAMMMSDDSEFSASKMFDAPQASAATDDVPVAADGAGEMQNGGSDVLLAADGEATDSGVAALTHGDLSSTTSAARARLAAAGVSTSDLALLDALSFQIADLEEEILATSSAQSIVLDQNAAGHGWFVDQSPGDDEEFPSNIGANLRRAEGASAYSKNVDLLTVVMREMVYVISQQRGRPVNRLRGLLSETLPVGVRHTPEDNADLGGQPVASASNSSVNLKSASENFLSRLDFKGSSRTGAPSRHVAPKQTVDAVQFKPAKYVVGGDEAQPEFASGDLRSVRLGKETRFEASPTSRLLAMAAAAMFNGINLNVGTLDANESLTVTFDVTINDPLPQGTCQISNQGTVTGDNFSPVVTDDPDTSAPSDPTVTSANTAPTVAGATVSQQQGSPAANYQIATVADGCTNAAFLSVNVLTPSPGINVTGIINTNGQVTANVSADCNASLGAHTIVLEVSDGSLTSTANLVVNVTANTAPTLSYNDPPLVSTGSSVNVSPATPPSDNGSITSFAVQSVSPASFAGTVSVDNAGVVSVTNASPGGSYTVTVRATDNCGAFTDATFVLNVNQPPVAACKNVTKSADGSCQALVSAAEVNDGSSDPDGDALTYSLSPAGPYPLGTTTVTLTVTDTHGASSSCTSTVTVVDDTKPSIAAPPALTRNTGANATECGAFISDADLGSAAVSDNCSGVTVTRTGVPADNKFPVGTTTITYTATDAAGNFKTDTQLVTVVDNTPPAISCPVNIGVPADANACSAVVNFAVGVTDNCPGVTVTSSHASGSTFPVGTTIVNVIAKDAAGNQSACSFSVTVKDTQAPILTSSVPLSVWSSPYEHIMVSAGLSANVTDNCAGNLPTQVSVYGDEDDLSTTGGDGNHSPDAKDIALDTLRLRRERKGNGDGRVYLMVTKATDAAGNLGFTCTTIVVPKSTSTSDLSAVQAQAAAAKAYCDSHNGAAPANYFVIGDGPIAGPNQ
jgi:uncharacterized repeat protein (TIGR01451 family)